MGKTYVFKTKDGVHQFILRGQAGVKKIREFEEKNYEIKIQAGGMTTTIMTTFEDKATLEKEVMY